MDVFCLINLPVYSLFSEEFSGISSVTDYEWLMFASAVSGSETTYACDYNNYNYTGSSAGTTLLIGGSYAQDQTRGLFYLDGRGGDSGYVNIGSRLMVLP